MMFPYFILFARGLRDCYFNCYADKLKRSIGEVGLRQGRETHPVWKDNMAE